MYIGKEHWLGLDNIYKLTNRKNVKTQLKIILEYKSTRKYIATYDDFHLKDQVEFTFTHMMMNSFIWFWFQTSYRLHLGHKTGDNIGNFRYSNNMAFTRKTFKKLQCFSSCQWTQRGPCPRVWSSPAAPWSRSEGRLPPSRWRDGPTRAEGW